MMIISEEGTEEEYKDDKESDAKKRGRVIPFFLGCR